MSSTAPSLAEVETTVETLAPPGTPLTTTEVAAEFGCTDRTIYNRLDDLVGEGALKTKKVGARARVWWRPPATHPETRAIPHTQSGDTELLDKVLETSPIGIVVVERDGDIAIANRRAEAILGLSRDEITDRTYRQPEWNISHEDGTPITAAEHPVTQVFETGQPVLGFEHRIEPPDGTERWLSSNSAPIHGTDGGVQQVVVGLEEITRQREREADIRSQRDELQRLDRVNTVVRSINRAIVDAESRAEIEQAVCDCIATSEPYLFAVVGEFSDSYETFLPRVHGGIDTEYLDQLLDRPDGPPISEGPGATAARTGEVQAVQELSDLPFEFWHQTAHDHGFQSLATVPLVFETVVYGVLGVYARQPRAFDTDEQAVLQELGETVGHAINALERQQALVSERVVELEFASPRLAEFFEAATASATVTGAVDRSIVLDDGTTLEYYAVTGADPERFRAALDSLPATDTVRILSQSGETTRFELRTDGPSMAAALASHGARLSHIRFADGDARIHLEVPYGRDIREAVDAVHTQYPDMEFVSRTTREQRTQTGPELHEAVSEALTDRQRTALEAAYAAGFFNWPRDSTGEELAANLDITPPTLHKHLRAAEEKIVAALFEFESAPPTG